MTVKELSQLYYLSREIEVEKKKLENLEEVATKTTQTLSPVPGGGEISDKTATAAAIADCRLIIESKKQQAIAEYNRLVRYIASIDDSLIRQIIKYRFINLLSWTQVANRINGCYTADSVRMTLKRFLQKN